MANEVYEQLAKALDKLPNGFPQTPSRVEIQVLRKIFSPKEATLACQLSGKMETAETIAKRIGLPSDETSTQLINMAKRGLLWYSERQGRPGRPSQTCALCCWHL